MSKQNKGSTGRAKKAAPDPLMLPASLEGRYESKRGRRLFTLDLKDRVKGLWDTQVGIPIVNQVTVECVGVNRDKLSSSDYLRRACDMLCTHLALRVEESQLREFAPGITLVYILAESHIAIHTWPEVGYLHIDIVTCTRNGLYEEKVVDAIGHLFQPSSIRAHKIQF